MLGSTQPPTRVLAIGGSDSSGSAGVQADLKTYEAFGVFGMTALTVVTAQNTLGVQHAHPLPVEMVQAQLQSVLNDIGANALKTGLLGRASIIRLLAEILLEHSEIPLVVDPVLVNGQGQRIVDDDTLRAYQENLFPLATIITPNLDEACLLTGQPLAQQPTAFYEIARNLYEFGSKIVLIKGGHLDTSTILDLLFDGQQFIELRATAQPIDNPHGIGCTFASAIAAGLALGEPPAAAVQQAHQFVQNALRGAAGWRLGAGRPPVNHRAGRP